MTKQTTINDALIGSFIVINEEDGCLLPIEISDIELIGFDPKRIFFVFNVNNQNDRGKHAHFETVQILVCIKGEIEVLLDDGNNKKIVTLDKPGKYVLVPNMIWDEQTYLNNDAVLLSICNTKYAPSDYINNYEKFRQLKNGS